uniref:Uncharacterized protein n=1 Tax=Paramoeba aestuarina TaxID=180227 RepID=A0A7S4P434_9EUKA|mmetsp:Transcript_35932/g.56192  ORF Transcript_35932/g.56192 Transcript_35932/m.56192 type:complete len:128 (+) Transcript_35932:164-547(+)
MMGGVKIGEEERYNDFLEMPLFDDFNRTPNDTNDYTSNISPNKNIYPGGVGGEGEEFGAWLDIHEGEDPFGGWKGSSPNNNNTNNTSTKPTINNNYNITITNNNTNNSTTSTTNNLNNHNNTLSPAP